MIIALSDLLRLTLQSGRVGLLPLGGSSICTAPLQQPRHGSRLTRTPR